MPELPTATTVEPNQVSRVSTHTPFFWTAAFLVLTIGTALRVYHLGERSLWYDEAVTADISRGTVTEVLAKTQRVSAPIIHPYILYVVEKIGKGAVAARIPSMLASLLAIVVMLGMARTRVGPSGALFSAAILAISASQVRYAQEVREYSLAVLSASILIYCFLRWEAVGSRRRQPGWLFAGLFFSPLVQYGLVFFGFAILSTMAFRLLFTRDTPFRFLHLALAACALAAGGLLTYFLTLRYQYHPGGTPWYLLDFYFDPKKMSLLHFLSTNSKGLLSFVIPGHVVARCFGGAAVIFGFAQVVRWKLDSVTLLVFTSTLIAMGAAVARLYPYGGVRQSLFLAPVLILLAGASFADLVRWLKGFPQMIVVIVVIAVIVSSGYSGIRKNWPYGEYEDTRSILQELSRSSRPGDQVWVNHDAVAAFEFYLPEKDPRFTYGTFHKDPQEYLSDLFGSIHPNSERLWLVFSHLEQPSDRAEAELMLSSLSANWDVRPVITPTNAALFLADRRGAR